MEGVDRYLDTRLADLERASPTISKIWTGARDRLRQRYGDLTVRQLLDRARAGR